MQHKHLVWLAGGALILGLAASFSLNRNDAPAPAAGAILPDFAPAQDRLDGLRIEGREDKRVALRRENGVWLVAERGYPANLARLKSVVDFLGGARILEEKSSLPENYEKLGVDLPAEGGSGLLVTALAGDKPLASLILGRAAQASRGQFVRRPEAAPSYLVDRELELSADPATWLEPAILDLPEAEVQRVEQGDSYVLKREGGQGSWQLSPMPSGKRLGDSYLVSGLAGALANLELVDVARAPLAQFDQAEKRRMRYVARDGRVVAIELAKVGDHAWLKFAVRYDEAEARAHAPGGKLDEAAAKAARAKAEAWAKKTEGWLFKVYATRGDSLSRPLSELVQDIPPPAKKP